MKKIQELQPGQSFYFPASRWIIYTFLENLYRKDGSVKSSKTVIDGKLYPIYMNPEKQVEVLPNFQSIKKTP